jgi:hypothetical protein
MLNQRVTLRRFGVIAPQAGTHVIMALFNDVGDNPSARVAATGNTTLMAGRNELSVALPPGAVSLDAGTYWLLLSVDATTQIAHGSASVPLRYVPYSHGSPLPSTLQNVASDTITQPNIYIVVLDQ